MNLELKDPNLTDPIKKEKTKDEKWEAKKKNIILNSRKKY